MIFDEMDSFDVIGWLHSVGIEPSGKSKHSTAGWINIPCPFCGDRSDHLGISSTNAIHCFRCGVKGTVAKLLLHTYDGNMRKVQQAIYDFQGHMPKLLKEKMQRIKDPTKPILPSEASYTFLPHHIGFLKNKGFDPDYVIGKYKLMACHTTGKYKHRIIIPVIDSGRAVSFTARDVTGASDKPYIACANAASIIPIKECIYNIDNVGKTILILEGTGDVWRIGDGSVATFGTEFTQAQIAKILSRNPRNVFVMFDGEPVAISQAHHLAKSISECARKGTHVEVVELSGGDPGEMSDSEVRYIRKEIFY